MVYFVAQILAVSVGHLHLQILECYALPHLP